MGNLTCRGAANIASAILKELDDDQVIQMGKCLQDGKRDEVSLNLLQLSATYDQYDKPSQRRIDALISAHVARLTAPQSE